MLDYEKKDNGYSRFITVEHRNIPWRVLEHAFLDICADMHDCTIEIYGKWHLCCKPSTRTSNGIIALIHESIDIPQGFELNSGGIIISIINWEQFQLQNREAINRMPVLSWNED